MYEPKIGDRVDVHGKGATVESLTPGGGWDVGVRYDSPHESGSLTDRVMFSALAPLRPTEAGQRVRDGERTGEVWDAYENQGERFVRVAWDPDGVHSPAGLFADALVRVADDVVRYELGQPVRPCPGVSDWLARAEREGAATESKYERALADALASLGKSVGTLAMGFESLGLPSSLFNAPQKHPNAGAYEWSASYLGKPQPRVPFVPPPPRWLPALGERVHCAATNETGVVVGKQAEHGNLYASVLLDCGEERRFGVGALAPAKRDAPCSTAPTHDEAVAQWMLGEYAKPGTIRVEPKGGLVFVTYTGHDGDLYGLGGESVRYVCETLVAGARLLAAHDVPRGDKPAELVGEPSSLTPIAARHGGRCPSCAKPTREAGTVRLFHWLCGCPVEPEGHEALYCLDEHTAPNTPERRASLRDVLVWGGGAFGEGWTLDEAMSDWRSSLAEEQADGNPCPAFAAAAGLRVLQRERAERKRQRERAARKAVLADQDGAYATAMARAPRVPLVLGRALTSSTPNGDGTHSCVVNIYHTGSDVTGLGKVRS